MYYYPQSTENGDAKRPKLDNTNSPPKSGKENEGLELSPEQKQRMEENRLKALAKLQAKNSTNGSLLVDVGESWKKALKDEFSKTYFEQVSIVIGNMKMVIVTLHRNIVFCYICGN